DHRLGVLVLRGPDHGVDIVEVAEGDHALQVRAGQGQAHGVRSVGQDQDVVGDVEPALGPHDLGGGVDGDDGAAGMEGDAVARVPGLVVDDDVVEGLLPRQHRGQHDAVVVDPGLGAEDGDVVA